MRALCFAADVAVLKLSIVEKDNHLMEEEKKRHLLEANWRNSRMEVEELQEELKNQRQETHIAQSKVKQLTLQLEIQQEKDLAVKAEWRLNDLKRLQAHSEAFPTPKNVPNPSRHPKDHLRDHLFHQESNKTTNSTRRKSHSDLPHQELTEKDLNEEVMKNNLTYIHSYRSLTDRHRYPTTSDIYNDHITTFSDSENSMNSKKWTNWEVFNRLKRGKESISMHNTMRNDPAVMESKRDSSSSFITTSNDDQKTSSHVSNLKFNNNASNNAILDGQFLSNNNNASNNAILDSTLHSTSSNASNNAIINTSSHSESKLEYNRLQKMYEKIVNR